MEKPVYGIALRGWIGLNIIVDIYAAIMQVVIVVPGCFIRATMFRQTTHIRLGFGFIMMPATGLLHKHGKIRITCLQTTVLNQ